MRLTPNAWQLACLHCVYGMVGYLVAFLSSVLLVIIALLLIMQWIVHPMVPYFTSLWFHPAVSLYRACLVRSFSWCCCWPSFAVSGISSICHSQCRGGCTFWCECKRILGRSSSENFFDVRVFNPIASNNRITYLAEDVWTTCKRSGDGLIHFSGLFYFQRNGCGGYNQLPAISLFDCFPLWPTI